MANATFLPSREAELVTWSINFKTRITATPTAFGLTAAQATTYGGLHDAFVAAYTAATNDGTNSRSAIVAKNTAKADLINNARLLAGIVQKFPGTTNEMRSELGLTVKDVAPSPIPAPSAAPQIMIESTIGSTIRIRLVDAANPTRRGKPDGVSGAAVFSFAGTTAPTTEDGWKFEGNTSRTSVDVVFPNTVAPGSKVWFTAFWFNPRSQSGPPSTPVTTYLPGGQAMAA